MAGTTVATEPVWLKNARQLVGLKEIVGSRHEAKVLEFFKEAGHPEMLTIKSDGRSSRSIQGTAHAKAPSIIRPVEIVNPILLVAA